MLFVSATNAPYCQYIRSKILRTVAATVMHMAATVYDMMDYINVRPKADKQPA